MLCTAQQVLLDLTKVLFEEQSSLAAVMENILLHTTSLLNCERSSILLVDSHNESRKFVTFPDFLFQLGLTVNYY